MQLSRAVVMTSFVLLGLASADVRSDGYVAPTDPAKVRPLATGSRAPAFTARTPAGESFRFDPQSLAKPALLIFYRGGWCPYCNAHLGQLRKVHPKLIEMGYEVLFLSADRPELLVASLKEKDLPYTILSDARMQAARAFGIAFRVDDATVQRYKEFGLDLEEASGETHHELPVPAVFIVDRSGTIRFAHWNPDYKVRIDPEELLDAAGAAARGELTPARGR
jgi:peroxiredoxin